MSSMRTGKNFFGDKLNKEEIKEHRGLTGQLSMRESSLGRALVHTMYQPKLSALLVICLWPAHIIFKQNRICLIIYVDSVNESKEHLEFNVF